MFFELLTIELNSLSNKPNTSDMADLTELDKLVAKLSVSKLSTVALTFSSCFV
ncbi:MAG: hypothetical protein BWY14_01308 [Parcubacteria group bacterium ADurb.Bin192]|nr:MAG: hypothetical protein BWY14_01308 [Parcubacteria group bacterium ADurb.Bin192]